jgi:hypothetical protein
MARFTIDPDRLNFTIERSGKEYNLRVLQRAQTIFSALLNLLPSNYISGVEGPNYTLELKAVAVELAKIELALEDVSSDAGYTYTRTDFLYSIIGYLTFLNGRLPTLEFDSEEFRQFLLNLIRIYFQGSIPKSIKDAVGLFLTEDYEVTENFLLEREGASDFDISDQFGFQISVLTNGQFPPGIFQIQSAIRTIVDIIRPAHTLFSIRYIFEDDDSGKITDQSRWRLASYYYEDFRSYWTGLRYIDRLGKKENQAVAGESHSADF